LFFHKQTILYKDKRRESETLYSYHNIISKITYSIEKNSVDYKREKKNNSIKDSYSQQKIERNERVCVSLGRGRIQG